MSTGRKGFTHNQANAPQPWSSVEVALFEDLIDTLVTDAIGAVRDTDGHKHGTLYDSDKNALITSIGASGAKLSISSSAGSQTVPHTIDSTSGNQLILAYNDAGNVQCDFDVDSDGYLNIKPSGERVNIKGDLNYQLYLNYESNDEGTLIGTGSDGHFRIAVDTGRIILESTLQLGDSYASQGGITATGYIRAYDSTGTQYKLLAVAA